MKGPGTGDGSAGAEDAGHARRLTAILVGVVVLATIAAFLPVAWNGFVEWDDAENLLNNEAFRGLSGRHLHWMFTARLLQVYQPLSWLAFGVQYVCFGLNSRAFHLVSLAVHAANAVIFFFLARRLIQWVGRWGAGSSPALSDTGMAAATGAATAALLFAVHPLRVEAVAWASGQPYLWAAMFGLLAVWAYVRAAESSNRGGRGRWLATAWGVYCVSLLCKAIMVPLPAVLLVLDAYPLQRLPGRARDWLRGEWRGVWLEKLAFAIPAAAAAGAAVWANRVEWPTTEYTWLQKTEAGLFGLVLYLWKTVLPWGLSPVYEMPASVRWASPVILVCGALVATAMAVAWGLRRRRPFVPAACLIYAIQLAPVLGFLRHTDQVAADRYTYVACMPWVVLVGSAVVWAWAGSPGGSRAGAWSGLVAAILIAVLLGVQTAEQCRVWRDPVTMWEHALAQPATTMFGDSKIAHSNLGVAYYKAGNTTRGEQHLLRALALAPRDPDVLVNVGNLYRIRGDPAKAADYFQRAIEVNPQDGEALHALGQAYAKLGRIRPALSAISRAAELHPNDAGVLNDLAWLLATAPAPALRDRPRAIRLAERVVELTRGESLGALRALAAIYSMEKRFDQAAATASTAFERAREQGAEQAASEIKEELAAYRAGIPFGRLEAARASRAAAGGGGRASSRRASGP